MKVILSIKEQLNESSTFVPTSQGPNEWCTTNTNPSMQLTTPVTSRPPQWLGYRGFVLPYLCFEIYIFMKIYISINIEFNAMACQQYGYIEGYRW
jgi:hypothetical protein